MKDELPWAVALLLTIQDQLPIPSGAPEWLIIILLLVNAYLQYLRTKRP